MCNRGKTTALHGHGSTSACFCWNMLNSQSLSLSIKQTSVFAVATSVEANISFIYKANTPCTCTPPRSVGDELRSRRTMQMETEAHARTSVWEVPEILLFYSYAHSYSQLWGTTPVQTHLAWKTVGNVPNSAHVHALQRKTSMQKHKSWRWRD